MNQKRINLRWIILLAVGVTSLLTVASVASASSESTTGSNIATANKECHIQETGLEGLDWSALPGSHIQVVLVVIGLIVGLISLSVFAVSKKRRKKTCVLDQTKNCTNCGKCYS
jgi:hypothetical protein